MSDTGAFLRTHAAYHNCRQEGRAYCDLHIFRYGRQAVLSSACIYCRLAYANSCARERSRLKREIDYHFRSGGRVTPITSCRLGRTMTIAMFDSNSRIPSEQNRDSEVKHDFLVYLDGNLDARQPPNPTCSGIFPISHIPKKTYVQVSGQMMSVDARAHGNSIPRGYMGN